MERFYAFVSAGSADADPLFVLRTAETKPELLEDRSYDPGEVQFWDRERLVRKEEPVEVTNRGTDELESAYVCQLEAL